jgi:phosphoribosylanthranilate isomerase
MASWVKICGLTTAAAVAAAVEAGADAIGFVFAASKRRVTPTRARELGRHAKGVVRVAVMQHPAQAELDEVLATFAPDVLQTDAEDLATLRLPRELSVTPVFRAGRPMPHTLPERVLFEGPVSGTGEVADWQMAADLAKRTKLILAGGLNPENVATAIARVRPFGVDVSSGVESAPGIKDELKIREFVQAARLAFREATSGVNDANATSR